MRRPTRWNLAGTMGTTLLASMLAGSLFGASTSAAPATQAVELERQGFESTVFPPPGWQARDVLADQSGSPANFTWGRETCDPAPGGGAATAWALRGGSQGGGLGCLEQHTGPVYAILRYGPIDTRPYPQGLEVNLLFKLDAPSTQAFTVCAEGPSAGLGCFGTGLESADWSIFPEPGLVFGAAGGKEEVYVEIQYADLLGMDPHFGALVDEVVIRGVGGSGTPVPSATQPATATQPAGTTPTAAASATAIPTVTSLPSSTSPAIPTATPPPTLTPRPTASATPSSSQTASPSATAHRTSTPPPTSATPPSVSPTATGPAPATPTMGPSPTADAPVPGTATAGPSASPAPERTPTFAPPSATPAPSQTPATRVAPTPMPHPPIFLPFAVLPRG